MTKERGPEGDEGESARGSRQTLGNGNRETARGDALWILGSSPRMTKERMPEGDEGESARGSRQTFGNGNREIARGEALWILGASPRMTRGGRQRRPGARGAGWGCGVAAASEVGRSGAISTVVILGLDPRIHAAIACDEGETPVGRHSGSSGRARG
jgi:hypothetical protein